MCHSSWRWRWQFDCASMKVCLIVKIVNSLIHNHPKNKCCSSINDNYQIILSLSTHIFWCIVHYLPSDNKVNIMPKCQPTILAKRDSDRSSCFSKRCRSDVMNYGRPRPQHAVIIWKSLLFTLRQYYNYMTREPRCG